MIHGDGPGHEMYDPPWWQVLLAIILLVIVGCAALYWAIPVCVMNALGKIDYGPVLAQIKATQLSKQVGTKLPAPKTTDAAHWPPDYTSALAWRQTQLARFELDPKLIASAKRFYAKPENAHLFINHWIDSYDPRHGSDGKLVKFPFIMFPRQEELVEFVQACIKAQAGGLIEKSRDMGATWVCVGLSVWLWALGDSSAIGWGSQKQEKVDRLGDPSTVFEKIRMSIRGLPRVFWPRGFDPDRHLNYMRCVNPETGGTIVGEIGDDIGRGGRTSVYFVDEAAHLAHPEAVEASLLETTRVRIDISSVSGLGTVFHRKREAGLDWEPGQPAVKGRANVFVMDWSHHPEKTREWYATRKAELYNNGLAHVFAQEIDRDYSAAAEGVIIPSEWVDAAEDAHIKLGFPDEGQWVGGLDVADEGLDRNAMAKRRGVVLKFLREWGERDVGVTTRNAIAGCAETLPIELQYDSIGIGAGVKSEANRLQDEGLLPFGLVMAPWAASAKVLNPLGWVGKLPDGSDDEQSMFNKDFFSNLKAQGWWMLRRRFELTYRAITEKISVDPDQLISLDSKALDKSMLLKVKKELSQPTASRATGTLKLVVDKAPEGARSPNLGDAVMMCYWPVPPLAATVSMIAPMILRSE